MGGLRKLEDSWIFEEPVTEDIAPGYFDAVEKPMDFQTVEKKIEAGEYTNREQVRYKGNMGLMVDLLLVESLSLFICSLVLILN